MKTITVPGKTTSIGVRLTPTTPASQATTDAQQDAITPPTDIIVVSPSNAITVYQTIGNPFISVSLNGINPSDIALALVMYCWSSVQQTIVTAKSSSGWGSSDGNIASHVSPSIARLVFYNPGTYYINAVVDDSSVDATINIY